MIVQSKIVDYRLPKEEKELLKYLANWQNAHSIDHQEFNNVLNSVAQALNQPTMSFSTTLFHFDPQNISSFQQFLMINENHHKELFTRFNTLGKLLATPIFTVPRYNIVKKIKDFSYKEIEMFLFNEERIHTLFARALTLMLEHL